MLQAVPYQEPTLIQLLVLASFLYLCNIARIVTDYLLYAGIVAEITLGIVYGSPLANLLPADWEHTFTALGYLGLILVVFEVVHLYYELRENCFYCIRRSRQDLVYVQ